MGSLTEGERRAVFWLLLAMLVFAGWSGLAKWRAVGKDVERGVVVDWVGEERVVGEREKGSPD